MKTTRQVLLFILFLSLLSMGQTQPAYAQTITSDNSGVILFQTYTTYPIGSGKAVAIGDINHDGRNDIVATTTGSIVIFYQNADGTLSTPLSYVAGNNPESLDIGDINNDGLKDIVVVDTYGTLISVFIQNSDGSLNSRITYASGVSPASVKIGDINNDGLNDIAVDHMNDSFIGVFTQKTDGTLNSMITYPSPSGMNSDIDMGDFNNDGLLDVVKLTGASSSIVPPITIYYQKPDGTLENGQGLFLGLNMTYGISVGDLTNDAKDDIALVLGGNVPSSSLLVFPQYTSSFGEPFYGYPAYHIPEAVQVADVSGDGRLDVLAIHGGWSALSVYIQQSTGLFSPNYQLYSGLPYASHYKPAALAVGDINGDNLADVLIVDYNNGLIVLPHVPMTTFSDVPFTHWAWSYIETLYKAGITGGCSASPLNFCPDTVVTRAQMAVFIERAVHGSGYIPPEPNGNLFGDVSSGYWAAAWIESLANEGITGGCGQGNYCPESSITRAQMAVFLLRGKYGRDYTPPELTGWTGFYDVSSDYWAAAWIKQLAAEGITGGCGNGNFCPDASVTRAQMAVFLTKTFSLP